MSENPSLMACSERAVAVCVGGCVCVCVRQLGRASCGDILKAMGKKKCSLLGETR